MTPHGVLVVDKPAGCTSHDVVARARRLLKTRAVGHAGTLDPMATGVLVLAIGEATKLVPWLTAADKVYEARVVLGAETDSLDADGAVVRTAPVPTDLAARLDEALEGERARTSQIPPAVSAIQIGGVRAHALARAGADVVLAPRDVAVRAITVLGIETDAITVRLEVGKGYYVRAFARDLAAALGTAAHLGALRRLRSGAFDLSDAVALEAPDPCARLVPLAEAARRCLPCATLGAEGLGHARAGRVVPPGELTPTTNSVAVDAEAWLDARGSLVAIGRRDPAGVGRVVRGFVP